MLSANRIFVKYVFQNLKAKEVLKSIVYLSVIE